MGLKTKSFTQILQSMVNWIGTHCTQLTNFEVGSVIRTLLEGISSEVEELYYNLYKNFKYAIECSILNSFNFSKIKAKYSVGVVTIKLKDSSLENIVIPKGYKFSTINTFDDEILYYESTQDVVIVPGEDIIQIPVQCTTPGKIGNVPAHSIKLAVMPYPFIDSIDNLVSLEGGTEEESIEDCQKRFAQYIQTLAKGTIPAIRFGCLSIPEVAGVHIEERPGIVTIYAHDSLGDLPDSLISSIKSTLIDYKAGGVNIVINSVVKKPINLNVNILLSPEYDLSIYKELVQTGITNYLNSFSVGSSLLKSSLIGHIMNIDKLAIINTTLDVLEDITIEKYELIRSGTINVQVSH